jgi:hypothetical protein
MNSCNMMCMRRRSPFERLLQLSGRSRAVIIFDRRWYSCTVMNIPLCSMTNGCGVQNGTARILLVGRAARSRVSGCFAFTHRVHGMRRIPLASTATMRDVQKRTARKNPIAQDGERTGQGSQSHDARADSPCGGGGWPLPFFSTARAATRLTAPAPNDWVGESFSGWIRTVNGSYHFARVFRRIAWRRALVPGRRASHP